MFCARCGSELSGSARFCSNCGAAATAEAVGKNASQSAQTTWAASGQMPVDPAWNAPQPVPYGDVLTKLQRPRTQRMVAGVCAGLAQHYHWDLTWVRVLTVLITVFSSGAGLVAYIVFWIVMPEETWMLPANSGASVPPVIQPRA